MDQIYRFTDCTSFVLMRRLTIARAVALDDDFRREGFVSVP
jgi:predicted nucleic acid-binding protein